MSISSRRRQRAIGHTAIAGYVGTSVGPTGYRIAEMFGGDGGGSWINTPMPNVTTVHADSATAVNDIVLNVMQHATGLPGVIAWPTLNISTYSATLNVVNSATTPLQPITITGSNATQSWAFPTAAMMYAGFPIPAGLQPTNDTDGTIHLYDPDWKWPGRPNDTQYWGRIWELWGAKSPEQNTALGNGPIWTARFGGRLTGVNQRLYAHAIDRTWQADVVTQADPSYGAPKAPNDTSNNTIYWGYGPGGVYESSAYMASASHLPMSHHILRISDMVQGAIHHPIGFSIYPMYPSSEGNKGFVWPATGYDAASRTWLKHGNRLRLPYDYISSYPSGMPVAWRPMYDMYIECFKSYGAIMVDTTGASFSLRAEPGIESYLPAGFGGKAFIQYLPWADMQMLAVGNDTTFYP